MSNVVTVGRRILLLAIVLVGLSLRLWSASSARVHDDEIHYVEDAAWSRVDLPRGRAIHFLRDHPRDHLRLDPDDGSLVQWGQDGRYPRIGHPALFAYLTGLLFAVTAPTYPDEAVEDARRLNAVTDATTIALLPRLLAHLGGGPAAGLLAAALYAVFPPAATYGSLAYLDPLLAPLLVGALVLATAVRPTTATWAWAGVVAGLAVTAKQTGLVTLAVVLLVAAARGGGVRAVGVRLAASTAAAFATVLATTSPAAYLSGLLDPLDPFGRLAPTPLANLRGNVAFLSNAAGYYWLGIARHGHPWAPALARLHAILTPAYLVAFTIGALRLLAARRRLPILCLLLPVVLTLAALPPSDGAWRAHILAPLVCATIALAAVESSRAPRVLLAAATVLTVALAWRPLVPAGDGSLGAADLLRGRAALDQPQALYDATAGRPPLIFGRPGIAVVHRLWLRPGRYRLSVEGSAWAVVALDGETLLSGRDEASVADVEGYLHTLEISFLDHGALRRLRIVPVEEGARP